MFINYAVYHDFVSYLERKRNTCQCDNCYTIIYILNYTIPAYKRQI